MATSTQTAPRRTVQRQRMINTSANGHILTFDRFGNVPMPENTLINRINRHVEDGYAFCADRIDSRAQFLPQRDVRRADVLLHFSMLIHPQIILRGNTLPYMALAVTAIFRILHRTFGKNVSILWPNRVMLGRRVLAAVTCEVRKSTGSDAEYVCIRVESALSDDTMVLPLLGAAFHVFGGVSDDVRERTALELQNAIYTLYERMQKERTVAEDYCTHSACIGARVIFHRIIAVQKPADDAAQTAPAPPVYADEYLARVRARDASLRSVKKVQKKLSVSFYRRGTVKHIDDQGRLVVSFPNGGVVAVDTDRAVAAIKCKSNT